ncbi:MAG TPA: helix-turn-helix domain-containing protein [Candidatus Nitrosotalea sp.]|nr:helix-turn-helix domain-containing protein [Candidatus Nitrosotalea sp.]
MKDDHIQQILFNQDSSNRINFQDHLVNLQKELSQFGFTANLSKVYIYLGKYGAKTAFDIVKALKIPRTETYNLLKILVNKGVVYSTMQHPMRFVAMPLDKAIWNLVNVEKQRINNLEQNSKNLVSLWNMIPDFLNEKTPNNDERFRILEGTNQIHAKVCEILKNSKEVQIIGSEKNLMKFYNSNMFTMLDSDAKDLKLLVSQTALISTVAKKFKGMQIKKTPNDIHPNLCFVINDSELLFYIRHTNDYKIQAIAFWSNSVALLYSMRILFDFIWSKSK